MKGKVYCWGSNIFGQLGNNKDGSASTPKLIIPIKDIFIDQISCGENHCLALSATGELYGWGTNKKGQLGQGHKESVDSPVKIPFTKKISMIKAGGSFSGILTSIVFFLFLL